MRNGKVLGSDKISAETLKALNHFSLELLSLLASVIYNGGVFPDDLYKSTFITIPKFSYNFNNEPCDQSNTTGYHAQNQK